MPDFTLTRRGFCHSLAAGCLAAGSRHLPAADDVSGDTTKWKKLPRFDAAEIAKQHAHGLIRAAHGYFEKHGTLPSAVIPNPKLPAGKRLCGLVLLLPFLDQESYMVKGESCFDQKTIDLGRRLYDSIDQSKAWDDPVNREAAKTLMPAFLTPGSGRILNLKGDALSHFAFVKGSSKGEDGAFPGEKGLKLADITDGTVSTLGIGQVNEDLGPWIAEGRSTARQLFEATKEMPASFGSDYGKGAMFATVDSMAGYFPFNKTTLPILQQMATRSGGELVRLQKLRKGNPFQEKA
jgi:hypothetical protein